MTHTPTPLTLDYRQNHAGIMRDGAEIGILYGTGFADGKAFAAHIVRCVNEREGLLHALRTVLPFLKDLVERPQSSASAMRVGSDAEDSLTIIRAVLAQAEREAQP